MTVKKRSGLIVLCAILLAAVLLCSTLMGGLLQNEQNKNAILQEKQEELAQETQEYSTETLAMDNTTPERAAEVAAQLGAELQMTSDGSFAALTLPAGTSVAEVYADKANAAFLEELSLDYLYSADELVGEATTEWPNYSVHDPNYSTQTNLSYINIGDVWNETKGKKANGEKVVVAIIDSGIDIDHEDFYDSNGNFIVSDRSRNFVAETTVQANGWGAINDTRGHGTNVAGVIAAQMNGKGGVGVASDVELLVLKCDNSEGKYSRTHTSLAMDYAIEQNVDVISFSISGGGTTALTQRMVEKNIVLVASAGNDSLGDYRYPASDPNVIGVGALGKNTWSLASYSAFGERSDIVAPGSVYVATIGGGYKSTQGTSFSCPTVAAAVALYIAKNGRVPVAQLINEIQVSAQDIGGAGEDDVFGYGCLDVEAFVLGERGTITYDFCTQDIPTTTQVFIRGKTLKTVPEPERDGLFFGGWYFDEDYTRKFVEDAYYTTEFTADTTLYAQWLTAEDVEYETRILEDDTLEIIGYSGAESELTVPQSIEGKAVSSIADRVFLGDKALKTLILPEGLRSVKSYAFYNCTNLETVVLPDSLTDIGAYVFGNCKDLITVTVGTGLKNIGASAFYHCSALGSITIPNGVTAIGNSTFSGCTSLLSVTLGEGVKTIGASAFYQCSALQTVVIPSEVTAIGDEAFNGCSGMISVTLGDKLQTIGESAFNGCVSLTGIIIPEKVTEIGANAFNNCVAVEAVNYNAASLADLDAESLIFNGLGQATDGVQITIGAKVTKIPAYLFYFDMLSVDVMETASSKIVSVTFAENGLCQSIGAYAFYSCTALRSIEIPEKLTSIGAYAFYHCTDLETIAYNAVSCGDLSVRNHVFDNAGQEKTGIQVTVGEKVTKIPAYLFCPTDASEGSPKILSLVFEAGSVCQSIGKRAFYHCSSLSRIEIGENVTTIGEYAFCNCTGLTSVTIPENVETFGIAAFSGCSALANVVLEEGVTSIGVSVFSNCIGLTDIKLPQSLTTISGYAFDGCVGLTSVTVPVGVTEIGRDAFKNCTGLSLVYVESPTVAQALTAKNACGYLCYYAEVVVVPSDMTRVGSYITKSLTAKESITYEDKEQTVYAKQALVWESDEILTQRIPCEQDGLTVYACFAYDLRKEVIRPMHTESGWIVDTAATCTADGARHIECTDCHISLKAETILKSGHDYGSAWSTDTTSHWHVCSCGEKDALSAHLWNTGEVTQQPTVTAEGVKTYTCTACSAEKTETVERLNETADPDAPMDPSASGNSSTDGDDALPVVPIVIAAVAVVAAGGAVAVVVILKKKKKA